MAKKFDCEDCPHHIVKSVGGDYEYHYCELAECEGEDDNDND